MRRAIPFLAVLILAAGVQAAPATRPAKSAASQPTTAPARVDPAFVADFNEHLLNARFDEVVGKLRAMGALAAEPKLVSESGPKEKYRRQTYAVSLGYAWEYAAYSFIVDGKGLIFSFTFTPAQFPQAPGSAAYARNPEYQLKPGNKWWLVKSQTFTRADSSNLTLNLTQARTADEAAQKMIAARKQTAARTAKAMKTEPQEWLAKMSEVEVHEWFAPQLKERHAERIDQ